MLHFVALAWPTEKDVEKDEARRLVRECQAQSALWRIAFERPGLVVLYSGTSMPQEICVLPADQGVILGTLFRARSDADCSRAVGSSLTSDEVRRMLESEGQALIENYWGNYVAILCDESVGPITVRGPATAMPCLHVQVSGIQVYFSRIETIACLTDVALSIDWPFIARSLLGPMAIGRTALQEVRELPPGHRQRMWPAPSVPERLWTLAEKGQASELTSFQDAAQTLRETVEDCAQAWIDHYGIVLHQLSGGLDSSIVLGCLAKTATPSQMTCITHYFDASDADERAYARQAALLAGCELVEYARTAHIDLREAFTGARTEINTGLRIASVDRIGPELALQRGATAITWGHGGDELFCRHHLTLCVADFIRSHGFRAGLTALVEHAAIMEGETGWTVLARAVCAAARPNGKSLTRVLSNDLQGACLLHPEVLRESIVQFADEDRATAAPHMPPGRAWQISLATARRPYGGPFAQALDPPNLAPLLSQPVIEACAQIPTWLHMQGRRDRAVARAAFVDVVPPLTLSRRDKGGAEDLSARTLAANLPFVRSALLEGQLAREHLIDRGRIEGMLRNVPSGRTKGTASLLELVGTEAWLHAWNARSLGAILGNASVPPAAIRISNGSASSS